MLAGTDPNKILTAAREMFIRSRDWSNPFGDGHASRRIMDILFDDIRQ